MLEEGPGYGARTDVLPESLRQQTAVEIDEELAAMLTQYVGQSSVEIDRGDAGALPFPDGRLGGAVWLTLLHQVPTTTLWDCPLSEVRRATA